jgi:hypothetical protein
LYGSVIVRVEVDMTESSAIFAAMFTSTVRHSMAMLMCEPAHGAAMSCSGRMVDR